MVDKPNSSRKNRHFRNTCDIVEEPNSSSKHGIRVRNLGMKIWGIENAEKVVFDAIGNTNVKFLIYSGDVYCWDLHS